MHGTELEIAMIKKVDYKNKKIYNTFIDRKKWVSRLPDTKNFLIYPEFSKHMLEIIPDKPYTDFLSIKNYFQHF